jgi:hypothetical protein
MFIDSKFKNIRNLKMINYFLILTIVILSVWSRWYNLDSYVSNIDDHLVASSILEAKRPLDIIAIKSIIHDTSLTTYNSTAKKFLRFSEANGHLDAILRRIDPVRPWFCVPNQSTYAPFQFFFTQCLINKQQSLKQLLFWGRFPSFIFSILSLFMFVYLINKTSLSVVGQISSLPVIAIYAFSFESIIYSKQMESYAIGLFASVLLLIVLLKILRESPNYELKNWLKVSMLFAVMIYMQYQMLIYVFAAAFTLFIYYYYNTKKGEHKIFYNRIFFSGLLFVLFIAPVYVLFISKHSNHAAVQWYQGPNAEYLFDLRVAHGYLDQVYYTARFFLINCVEVFLNNCSFYSGSNLAINFIMRSVLLLFSVFFVYGLVVIFKSTDKYNKYLGLFLFVFLFVWLFFTVLGKFTMSPTRHTLILLPMFCLVCHFGLTAFIQLISNHRLFIFLIYITTCFMIFSFTKSIRWFLDDRKELFTQAGIVNIIKSRQPDYIVTTNEIVTFIPELRNNLNLLYVSSFKSKERWCTKKFVGKNVKFCFINFEPNQKNLKSINHFFNIELSSLKIDSVHSANNYLVLPGVKSDELHNKFPRIVENCIYFAESSN